MVPAISGKMKEINLRNVNAEISSDTMKLTYFIETAIHAIRLTIGATIKKETSNFLKIYRKAIDKNIDITPDILSVHSLFLEKR
jgi:hypothetical protein